MVRDWTLLCALLGLSCSACAAGGPRRPNFVLFMIDDLGIGDLGCYGNDTLKTPNIDRLAKEGVRLTQHIASSPLCTPSRAGFLTGRYPIRSGMASQSKVGVYIISAASGGLPSQELTFARLAKEQGYSTALIGKWHLGLNCDRHDDLCHHPNRHGFGHFYGISMTNLRDCQPGHGSVFQHALTHVPYGALAAGVLSVALLHVWGVVRVSRRAVLAALGLVTLAVTLFLTFVATFRELNCFLMRNGEVVEQPYVSENLTRRMTAEALHFLDKNVDKPFLLFLSFLQVHTALFASPHFRGRSAHGLYGDAVMEVDWSVGEVLRALERLQLAEQTLVYLTSDQGPHLEEISVRGEVHHGSSGIYRAGSAVWKVFFFTPIFHPENSSACFHTHACFCTPGYVTFHQPPLLFDLSRDPSESQPLTPDTEPAFHAVLQTVAEATERHRRGLVPVPDQLAPTHLLWKPWLQPCCSSWGQLCRCSRDSQQGELPLSH